MANSHITQPLSTNLCCQATAFEGPKVKCISLVTIVALLAIGSVVVGILAILASLPNNLAGLGVMQHIGMTGGITALAIGGIVFALTTLWGAISKCHTEKVVWLDTDLDRFCPFNTWSLDTGGPVWQQSFFCKEGDRTAQFIIDDTTGDKYLNQDPLLVRIKCGGAALITPVLHVFGIPVNIVYRIIRIAACLYNIKEAMTLDRTSTAFAYAVEIGKDLLRICVSPLILPLLEISALYGIFQPNDGKKLYANIEAAYYGDAILSGCFQPNPIYHTFGGDLNDPNAW